MTSKKKVLANRLNAQKSTGPRTQRGKRHSRFNALKAGAYAVHRPLPNEDSIAYETLQKRLIERYQPSDPVEELLVDQILGHIWRIGRLERVERAYLKNIIENKSPIEDERDSVRSVPHQTNSASNARGHPPPYPKANCLENENTLTDTPETKDYSAFILKAFLWPQNPNLLVRLGAQRCALTQDILWLQETLEESRKAYFRAFAAPDCNCD